MLFIMMISKREPLKIINLLNMKKIIQKSQNAYLNPKKWSLFINKEQLLIGKVEKLRNCLCH